MSYRDRYVCDDRVITYVLLCGYQPFRSDDPNEVAKETMRGKIEFHERYWKNVSEEGGSPNVPCVSVECVGESLLTLSTVVWTW
jgi:hypothetical protein